MNFNDFTIVVCDGVITTFNVIQHFVEEDCFVREATDEEAELYLKT